MAKKQVLTHPLIFRDRLRDRNGRQCSEWQDEEDENLMSLNINHQIWTILLSTHSGVEVRSYCSVQVRKFQVRHAVIRFMFVRLEQWAKTNYNVFRNLKYLPTIRSHNSSKHVSSSLPLSSLLSSPSFLSSPCYRFAHCLHHHLCYYCRWCQGYCLYLYHNFNVYSIQAIWTVSRMDVRRQYSFLKSTNIYLYQ